MGFTHSNKTETENEKERNIYLAAQQRMEQLQVKETTRRAKTGKTKRTMKRKARSTPAPLAHANPWAPEFETDTIKGRIQQPHPRKHRLRNHSHTANDTYDMGHGDPCG